MRDHVATLRVQDVGVAALPDYNVRDRLAQGGRAFLRHADVDHANDLIARILQRSVGGHIPLVYHESAPDINFTGDDFLQDGARRAVRLPRRDKGADGAPTLLRHHICCYAQHVTGLVHTLEKRAGAAHQRAHLVHHRDRLRRIDGLAQPGIPNH